MDVRNVSVDDFLVWPDDRPTDGDMIRDFIAAGRSREEWLFIGYVDDAPTLRIGYRTIPRTVNPENSGSLASTRLFAIGREGTDRAELFRTLVDQTIPRDLPDDVHLLETRLNESKHADAEVRAAELEAVGFQLLMAKSEFVWYGTAIADPRPEMQFRTVEEVGRKTYTDLIAMVGVGGLDREMAHYKAHMDINHWAEEHLLYLGDRDDMLVVGYIAEEPIGVVSFMTVEDNGWLAYVGVRPEHRGNGYVDDLVRCGTQLGINEGWNRIRAQTDLVNRPTRESFERCGYREAPGSRMWGHVLAF